jgi:hypothetical protein
VVERLRVFRPVGFFVCCFYQIETMSETELAEAASATSVFARLMGVARRMHSLSEKSPQGIPGR